MSNQIFIKYQIQIFQYTTLDDIRERMPDLFEIPEVADWLKEHNIDPYNMTDSDNVEFQLRFG